MASYQVGESVAYVYAEALYDVASELGTVAEIEEAIAGISAEDFVEPARWFDAERNRKWDRQVEEDAQSGRLRDAYQRLQTENEGQVRSAAQ